VQDEKPKTSARSRSTHVATFKKRKISTKLLSTITVTCLEYYYPAMTRILFLMALCVLQPHTRFVNGFRQSTTLIRQYTKTTSKSGSFAKKWRPDATLSLSGRRDNSRTALQMGFNLPPSKNPLGDVLPAIATLFGLILVLASPLGGILFAITNSLLLVALVTPLLLFITFQLWAKFNTLESTCPNCSAPVVVLKSGTEATPCLNCGALVRLTLDGKGVELCNPPPDFSNSDSLLDFLNSSFGQQEANPFSTSTLSETNKGENRAKKAKRESTIIDVDATKEE